MNEIRKRTVMPKIRIEKNKHRCKEMLNFARKYYLKLGIKNQKISKKLIYFWDYVGVQS